MSSKAKWLGGHIAIFPIYGLKLLQIAGHSICLVVTRHFSFMSSYLSSIMSSRAKWLGRDIKFFRLGEAWTWLGFKTKDVSIPDRVLGFFRTAKLFS
jgi:hypothetical protein